MRFERTRAVQVGLHLPEEVVEKLKEKSAKSNESISMICRDIIEKKLKTGEKVEPLKVVQKNGLREDVLIPAKMYSEIEDRFPFGFVKRCLQRIIVEAVL